MLKNMLNRVDNFGGNMGLQSNFSRVAAKGKKVKLEEPATSGESGSDSEDSAVYDMGDQFIDDMDRVDLGTQEDFKRVKDEGFYVISEPFLSHIYSQIKEEEGRAIEARREKEKNDAIFPRGMSDLFQQLAEVTKATPSKVNAQKSSQIMRKLAGQLSRDKVDRYLV